MFKNYFVAITVPQYYHFKIYAKQSNLKVRNEISKKHSKMPKAKKDYLSL